MTEPAAKAATEAKTEGTGAVLHHGVATPIGLLVLAERRGRIIALDWAKREIASGRAAPTPLLDAAAAQIGAYFAKTRRAFDLPLDPQGSAFQKSAWARLCQIPWGETLTYGEMAAAVGGSARAIGTVMGANPIPIIIPCHRVVAAAGRLGGYSGGRGPATKLHLLRHEGALLL